MGIIFETSCFRVHDIVVDCSRVLATVIKSRALFGTLLREQFCQNGTRWGYGEIISPNVIIPHLLRMGPGFASAKRSSRQSMKELFEHIPRNRSHVPIFCRFLSPVSIWGRSGRY